MSTHELPSPADQYTALTTGAGLCALPRTRLELAGRDRAKFLHNFCTNDIKGLTPGTGCEAFITSVQGKILGHGHVLCEEERLVFDTVAGQAETLLPHLDKYLIVEDVQLADRSAQESSILVAGAQAAEVLTKASGLEIPAEQNAHRAGEIAGVPVTIARLPLAGPNSLVVTCPTEQAADVTAALFAAGATPCEAAAVDALRVEAGYPLYGVDITPANLPQEVARDQQALSFTKGCYLGQETVARIDALGHVNKLLVGLRLTGDAVPTAGETLIASGDDKPLGQVTSAVYSPRLAAPLALAYLRTAHAAPGKELLCGAAPAEVVALPLS